MIELLFLPNERGQGLVEYALILVLVALIVIVILALLGPAIGNIFSNIVSLIENSTASPTRALPKLGGLFRFCLAISGSELFRYRGNCTFTSHGRRSSCSMFHNSEIWVGSGVRPMTEVPASVTLER